MSNIIRDANELLQMNIHQMINRDEEKWIEKIFNVWYASLFFSSLHLLHFSSTWIVYALSMRVDKYM